eukprot:1032111-Ditylum_brightwellii.AAC.1
MAERRGGGMNTRSVSKDNDTLTPGDVSPANMAPIVSTFNGSLEIGSARTGSMMLLLFDSLVVLPSRPKSSCFRFMRISSAVS